jgi:nucleotide-binding universal stress UspA family protein
MSEVILVVLGRPEAASGLLRAAERLADLAGGARVNALAVRTPLELTALMADASVPADALAALAAEERGRVAALKAAFDAWAGEAREASVRAHWSLAEEHPDAAVGDGGRRADFVVAARPGADDGWPVRRAFHAALFATGRPVLVVPPGGGASAAAAAAAFGRRVGVAWRDDGRAVRAVLPALRCLSRAERVVLLCGVREGAAPPGVPAVFAEHGVAADLRALPVGGPGAFGARLLAEAHGLGLDLLVMGAYAHSPLREAVLGGVTRHVLAHADLPVLMRH